MMETNYQSGDLGDPQKRRRMTRADMREKALVQKMASDFNECLADAKAGLIDYDPDCEWRFDTNADPHQRLIIPMDAPADDQNTRTQTMQESIRQLQGAVEDIQNQQRSKTAGSRSLFGVIRQNSKELLSLQVSILEDMRAVAWDSGDWNCLASLFARSIVIELGHGGLFCVAYLCRYKIGNLAYALGKKSLEMVAA